MYDLNATAHKIHGRLVVHVSGQLADSCTHADVIDQYPGGKRVYFVDPGAAQVFISEWKTPGICMDVLIPWNATVHFVDDTHKKVEIFVNEQKELTIPVVEKDQFSVYVLTGGINPTQKFLCGRRTLQY